MRDCPGDETQTLDCAARGQDELAPLVDQLAKGPLDLRFFIRNKGFGEHLPALVLRRFSQRRTAQVIVITAPGTI